MNVRTLLFLLYLLPAHAFASADTLYYDKKDRQTDREHASEYLVFTRTAEGYDAVCYDLLNRLRMAGHYAKIDSNLKNFKDGAFIYYDTTGAKSSEGVYKGTRRQGNWRFYVTGSTFLRSEIVFNDGQRDGPAVFYNAVTHQKLSSGQYTEGKKQGPWKFYSHDSLTHEYVYEAGKTAGITYYYPSGTIRKKMNYENGHLVSAQAYNEKGEATELPLSAADSSTKVHTYVQQMPVAGYDLSEYLSENMVYPAKARKNGIEGRVIVKFVVNEDGHISDVTVIRSVDTDLDDAAVRAISQMPDWTPGKQNGENVKVYFTMPVSFRLK